MRRYIPQWEPRKKWVEYEDGSFEPVNHDENIHKKPRGPNEPDWWVVTEKPDWRPSWYADTKRGRKAERESGTSAQADRGGPAAGQRAENKKTLLPPRPEDNDRFERSLVEYAFDPITSWFMSHHGRNKMRERLRKEKEQYTDENDWAMRAGLEREAEDYTRWDAFKHTYKYRNNDRAFAAMRDRAKKRVVPESWHSAKKE